ncbi:MAG: ankyrin repeat domain-containing protein [Planctomycetes bacterium]|jgi:hypothetical protein|nr:ankyrin repeat domain-containing protein [Planctomycetota bacterium]
MVRLLIDHGADLTAKVGADVNARDPHGHAPLHEAVFYGRTAVVQRLLADGADASVKTTLGETALQRAVAIGFVEIVVLLGGDPNDLALGSTSRCILVEDARQTWFFLQREMVEFDDIWIPEQVDFAGFEASLKQYLAQNTQGPGGAWLDSRGILASFNDYVRRYSGFIEDDARYVLCCLDGFDDLAHLDQGLPWVCDGGCGIVVVVFDALTKRVVHIHCHGFA